MVLLVHVAGCSLTVMFSMSLSKSISTAANNYIMSQWL
uniref:Uncharacterized protein n=1 Tax=Rhizophora mucronata TaxID=61149 RepID=A0A2P2PYH2_RHIMU